MDIVPVLDIRDGIVVHARRGERASYAPLRSALVDGCEPAPVLHALLGAASGMAGASAPAAYIADLDGIVHGRPQWGLLERLQRSCPVPLWLDVGFASAEAAVSAARRGFVPVIGSESMREPDALAALNAALPADAWLLSLDNDGSGPRDPAGTLQRPGLWPRRVIAMDLTRVGSETGGVGGWLERCMALAPDRAWVAAGGVRGHEDLQALRAAGVAAALIATALHKKEPP